ncbi:Transmembrane protein [Quillaja saponaria]|uniref:Transmembrane protein n=1 Tax=Quillaja saponaria TaxID=32244 RepID=A0AAD7LKZ8_QUISA|nr:Transmembrane protein [Quillaja saponaria]
MDGKLVSYQKRNRKPSKTPSSDKSSDLQSRRINGYDASADVFRSIEQHSEERRRRALEAQMAYDAAAGEVATTGSKRHSDDDYDSDAEVPLGNVENGAVDVKKVKPKKTKKPKVTVSEAASKLNAADLSAFLADITVSYESQQDIQLMRFADYYGRAFSSVNSAQFPWLKIFKESPVGRFVDIPVSHIAEDVYKTSVDWISQRSSEALGSFVLWSLDSILSDFASHQGTTKGSKKVVQHASSKSQVAIFVVLALALRRKPDVVISLLPKIKESPKYHGQEKLPVIVWVIAQASQGDLVVGLYLWTSLLLPLLSGKSGCNPQSRDLILQLVERILSSPKARPILLNGAVRKGERIVPPLALEALVRITFPLPSARVKATERFQAVYPTLKEVALAGVPGSKAMKQLAQQIWSFTFKAAGEGNLDLSREASGIAIWCLTQNPDCYKHWDMLYLDNLDASVIVLKKLSDEWKEHSVKHPTLDPLRETLKSFRQKNAKELAKEDNGSAPCLTEGCRQVLQGDFGAIVTGQWMHEEHGSCFCCTCCRCCPHVPRPAFQGLQEIFRDVELLLNIASFCCGEVWCLIMSGNRSAQQHDP